MVHSLAVGPVRDYRPDAAILDGDLARVEVADDTPDGGLPFTTTIQSATVMGRPVKPEFMPTRIEWRDPQPIPDFEATRVVNVSERAKALIESFEPGRHQFLPVTFVSPDGEPLEERYFLIVGNRIDSVDRTHSRMRLAKDVMWTPNGVANAKLVFNEGQRDGAHIWRDKHLTFGLYISDELAAAIAAAGLTGVAPRKVESV